ncbi:hypothetical protein SD70_03130 [Gordoniibacillus kamchatkensis]|uniref:Sugar ABC transporter substrate-binding protein n=1 Tax=Gordoniibacillus kamchatkensis TaxID=1590651 RepID=A0ABR5AME3_9BACL|nr:sugar ABC transporter substrate-binding protein [Paenibacillus sp. VKM B-2647]KIL42166.1 hypothetical protein SD70_03130 [Paenibacillus sp. VKM B-2647]
MQRKMFIVLVCAALALMMALAGCSPAGQSGQSQNGSSGSQTTQGGNGGTPAKPVKLTYLDPLPSPERTALMQDLLKRFHDQNPNIEVEYQSVPWDQASKKWLAMGASGTLPDVVSIDDTSMTGLAAAGYIENLQPYYDKWSQTGNLTEASKLSRNKYKGNVYAIPDGFGLQGLFVRTDWFKELNLEPKIETWDDYFDLAKKLTDPAKGRYGISFRGGANGILRAMEYVVNAVHTDSWFEKDGKSILYRPEAAAAFKKFYSVYLDGYAPKESINWGFNEMVQGFMNGQAGILNQTPEVIVTADKNMKPGTWTVLPMPKASDGKRYMTWGYTAGYAMSAKSQNKAEAWKLIEFLSSPEINLEYCKKFSAIPIYKKNMDDPFFKQGPIAGYAASLADANIVYSTPPSYLTELPNFSGTYAVQETQKYLTGAQSLDDTVKHLADFLTQAQQKYMKENPQ